MILCLYQAIGRQVLDMWSYVHTNQEAAKS